MIHVTHRYPKEAALWANTLADVYIEDTISTRVEGRARPRVAAGAPGRHPEEHARGPGPPLHELPEPGPVRCRRQHLRRDQPRSPSSPRPHRGPGPPHRPGGGPQADRAAQAAAVAGRGAPVRGRPHDQGLNSQVSVQARAGPPPQQYKEGIPRSRAAAPGGQAQQAKEKQGRRSSPPALDYEQLQKRESELRGAIGHRKGASRRPEPQGGELDANQEGSRIGEEPLRRAPAEAQRDGHRRLHPQQTT